MTFRPVLPVVILLMSCSSEPPPAAFLAPVRAAHRRPQRPAPKPTPLPLSVPAKRPALRPKTQAATTYALLQGTWQSTEDLKDIFVPRGHRRIDYYAGVPLDTTDFILDRVCPSQPGGGHPSDNGRYLVEPREDMYWEVVGVNADGLELSHVARGNTLNY